MKRILTFFILLMCIMSVNLPAFASIDNSSWVLSGDEEKRIDEYVKKQMKKAKAPGLSIIIVKEDKSIYKKNFGYADLDSGKKTDSGTLYELGSSSKAFTGLGILLLKDKGLIDLNDSVEKYIPWFWMEYNGKKVDITLAQLLNQTSGIPFETIGHIPASSSSTALEDTVRTLVGKDLVNYPGEQFLYATINYDILGLVIQNITGQPYEEYMKNNIIKQIGLHNTFVGRQEAVKDKLATGYKIGFGRALAYDAPAFKGNTPAGYIISNLNDIETWVKIQLGLDTQSALPRNLIEQSHIPNRTVSPDRADYSSYASGWFQYQSGVKGEYFHAGSNPNFSSSIAFRPEEKMGVAVLSNINSGYIQNMSRNILNILRGKPTSEMSDMYKNLDTASFTIACITAPLAVTTLILIIYSVIEIFRKRRKFSSINIKSILGFLASSCFIAAFGYCLYKIPSVLFFDFPWDAIFVWAPISLIAAIISVYSAIVLFYVYVVLSSVFKKSNEKHLFFITVLSVASGLGNAIIIFIVNQAVNNGVGSFQGNLFMYFIMGIIIYVVGQKLIRTKLITLTNNFVFTKRMVLIENILKTSYQSIETLEGGKIQAGLNNDTEAVSNFANVFIDMVTNLVTLVTCFIYLGFINIYGLLVSLGVILFAAGLYFMVGMSANRLWEQTRDIQNVFFKFINDIIFGFKELSLNILKRNEFKNDMQQSCLSYRDKRIKANLKFINVFVVGELLFTFVIGAVAFVFPLIFKDIENSSLSNYIFVFLYMASPVRGILNTIPNIFQMRISFNRINILTKEISSLESLTDKYDGLPEQSKDISLQLKGVQFEYKNSDGELFKVGPINYEFNSSETIFITGGNGSGKSTLAKLLTGLYKPDAGEIILNGNRISSEDLGQKYSAIYSDFYLFEKLYGIDHDRKADEIDKHLKVLHIADKIQIRDGVFSSTQLSTGQRKRMALLISYLEDRPICLFDEWAADQDPEFRKYFYNTLLPELKDKGKCIIAITHDDRYFNTADKVIKMEMGQIISQESHFQKADYSSIIA